MKFSVKVYKQYFNFSSSHFLIFKDGTREPLHGHNYRVMVRGDAPISNNDMVFDFLDLKPIVKKVCDSLDHRLLLPGENPLIKLSTQKQNLFVHTPEGDQFSFPLKDVLILPLTNISAERLAMYLSEKINQEVKKAFDFYFQKLEVEVEETPGQSATFYLENNR
jgi:6-pyruvoyltetrahydropterin/6-carboxytetrahydropterin synthase